MNILYLISHLGGGGTEAYIYTLAQALKEDNNIYIIYGEKGQGFEKFEKLQVPLVKMDLNSPYDLKAAKALKKFSQENNIELIHTQFLRENSLAVISKLMGNRARLINTRHMMDENSSPVKIYNRFLARKNHSIIAVSKSVKELLVRELGPRDNIELIYTGVDLNSFKSANYDFRSSYNIDEETILITSTARLSKEKGHEFIVRSLTKLKETSKNKDFKLVFIGDGPELNNIRELARELSLLDQLIFTGYQEDIVSILKASDIFLLASQSEAFGISILEAMACGLPIVTTDSGGTREIIAKDSKAGFLIDYGSSQDLVSSLDQLINNKELRLAYGQEALRLSQENFNLRDTIYKTYDLYRK